MKRFHVLEYDGSYSILFKKKIGKKIYSYQNVGRLSELSKEEAMDEASRLEDVYPKYKKVVNVKEESEWILVYISPEDEQK